MINIQLQRQKKRFVEKKEVVLGGSVYGFMGL
jgi:hypothetical protein